MDTTGHSFDPYDYAGNFECGRANNGYQRQITGISCTPNMDPLLNTDCANECYKKCRRFIRPTKVLLSEEIASIVGVKNQRVLVQKLTIREPHIIVTTSMAVQNRLRSVTAVRQTHVLPVPINSHVTLQATNRVLVVHRVNTKTKPIRHLVKHVWEQYLPIKKYVT